MTEFNLKEKRKEEFESLIKNNINLRTFLIGIWSRIDDQDKEFISRLKEEDTDFRSELISLILDWEKNQKSYPFQELLINIENKFKIKIDKHTGDLE